MKINKIARLRRELIDDDKNYLDSVNTALHNLGETQDNLNDDEEPKLDNFYKPSNEMENHMLIAMGVIGLGFGFTLTKLFLQIFNLYYALRITQIYL